MGTLGYAHAGTGREKYLNTKAELLEAMLVGVSSGGRAAEEVVFGKCNWSMNHIQSYADCESDDHPVRHV